MKRKIIVIVLLIRAFGDLGCDWDDESRKSATSQPTVGDVILLRWAPRDTRAIFGAVDEPTFHEMIKARLAQDGLEQHRLVTNGRVILLPAGTRGRILHISVTVRQIRILDGEYQDRAFWVPMDAAWMRAVE